MTEPERLLWEELRRRQILGVQFLRQKPMGPYVVDFYCSKARLVIELDGGQHHAPDHEERDRIRDQALQALDLTILRFRNAEVLHDLQTVVDKIEQFVSHALASTDLPRSRRPTQYSRPKRKRKPEAQQEALPSKTPEA